MHTCITHCVCASAHRVGVHDGLLQGFLEAVLVDERVPADHHDVRDDERRKQTRVQLDPLLPSQLSETNS